MNISDNAARAGKWVVLDERMRDTIVPELVRRVIEVWTNRLMQQLSGWL